LAEIGILSGDDLTYDDLFESSIMTTESERALKRKEFLKTSLANTIELIEGVEQAEVELVMPESDRTILDEAKESKASILITTNEKLASGSVESIAKLVATGVDNLSLNNVTVIDSTGRLLFDGQTVTDSIGNISSRTEYEMQKELMVKSNVRSILLSAGEYDDAMVTVDLIIDFDELEQVTERHSTQDGTNTGIIVEDNTYLEESENATTGGVPGTDANGVTDTMIADGNESTVTIEERNVVYTYDTEVATAVKAIGGVIYDDSTVSVSLTKYRTYDQEMLESQEDGILAGRTWEQFKYDIMQEGRTKIEDIDEDIVEMIRMASNVDNVMVLAYEVITWIRCL
jgi:flagellar M-ring protein FliF